MTYWLKVNTFIYSNNIETLCLILRILCLKTNNRYTQT